MLNDSFKITYTSVPVAISSQNGPWKTDLHNHREFEILLVTKGCSTVTIGNKKYLANKGDMLFVNPMEIHSVTVESESYSHKCLCFDCMILTNNTLKNDIKNGTVKATHFLNGNTETAAVFNNLYSVIEKKAVAYDMEAIAYINIIFSHLLKNGLIQTSPTKQKNIDFSSEVLNYISKHFCEELTSGIASSAMSFNHSYFCRKFKKNFGVSFSNYLNGYRISLSKAMLEDSSKTVADIAYECGFSNPAYFSKCFKRSVGILPAQYRKSQ